MMGDFLISLCRPLESQELRPWSEEVGRILEQIVPKGADAAEGESSPQAP